MKINMNAMYSIIYQSIGGHTKNDMKMLFFFYFNPCPLLWQIHVIDSTVVILHRTLKTTKKL